MVMKKILLAFAVSVFAFSLSFAQDDGLTQDIQEPRGLASIWKSAEEAYATGDFAGAARHYESLVSSGASSPSLFYNLGNAYYRGGNIGKSVLNYERALKLDPSDADARHNLELARAHTLDKIDNVPEFIFFSWIKNLKASLSSNTWAVISLVLLAAGIAILLLFRFSRRSSSRRIFFIIAMICFLTAFFCWMFSFSLARQANGTDTAIVVENIGSVKSSPSAGGNSIFVLHEGTKVKILEKVQDWCRVEISDGRQGWIKASDIEVI